LTLLALFFFRFVAGLDLNSVTRPLIDVVTAPREEFAMDSKLTYSVAAYNIVKRIFQTSVETRLYSSLKEKLYDLAVSASITIEMGVFGGAGSAEVRC
jgi:hypothetical protein